MSRYLRNLGQRIASAPDAVSAASLRAQRAIHLARQGQHDEVAAIVRTVRDNFGTRPNAVVTCWVSLAEGLDHFYRRPGPEAMDRLQRADALANALQHPVLVPLCAAWLAHMEFNANRVVPMVNHAARSLRLARGDHHAALARVSLDIADALHFAGRFNSAKPWYSAVRSHALAEGDDAMIAAMLHNVATLRVNQIRLADSFGRSNTDEIKRAILEMASSESYDLGIGTRSLPTLLPLVRAQLKTTTGEFSEALDLYTAILDARHADSLPRRASCFFADRAWCSFRLGALDAARSDVDRAIASANAECDADDLATTHARVAAVLEALNERELAAQHRLRAEDYLSDHVRAQGQWLQHLVTVLPSAPKLPDVRRVD